MTTVYTIDPAAPDSSQSATVMAGGSTVYASPSSLYVTSADWGFWQGASEDTSPPPFTTEVHKFDITTSGPATYVASGQVGGTTIGQYAMSERNGDLRIATTDHPPEPGITASSAVTVLRPVDGQLVPVGAVGGLGQGQSIMGVRFVGDYGFVVTFFRRDPLYVIDLRDPTAPVVRGALDVSGYSAYLHPMADGYLIGVGQEADDNGTTTGLQVSVFDVRDPDAPSMAGRLTVDGAYTSVEHDPHAFLYWEPLSLGVIPLSTEGTAMLVQADPGGVVELGRVHHPDDNPIVRSVVANGSLFTISYGGVLATTLDGLAPGNWAPFPN
jgi:uncharacterized secreted protein with C-terminal beta-propeller domain